MKTNSQIRNSARECMQGHWGKGAFVTFLYVILCIGSSYLSILALFFVLPLALGWYIFSLNLVLKRESLSVGNLFGAFGNGLYWKSIGLHLLMALYTFLWTLLLIVPGFIKSYSYRLAPFLSIENPELSSAKAIEKSMKMMKGHKMDLFLIDLGYTAWCILGGILTLGLGLLWIIPYYQIVAAKFYVEVKREFEGGNPEK